MATPRSSSRVRRKPQAYEPSIESDHKILRSTGKLQNSIGRFAGAKEGGIHAEMDYTESLDPATATPFENDEDDESPPISLAGFSAMVLIGSVSCIFQLESVPFLPYGPQVKLFSRFGLSLFMFAAAYMRLDTRTAEFIESIVPPPLPPKFCVYASGFAEFVASLLLLAPGDEGKLGAKLVCLILIAVFPANIYHSVSEKAQRETKIIGWVLWARIFIQFIFFKWASWHIV